MNTFEVVPTPANARKLMRYSSMMNINIDPVVADLAKLEVFDTKSFYKTLPADLATLATDELRPAIEYAADCDWRCMVFAKTQYDMLSVMLLTALASGLKPITFLTSDGKSNSINAVKNFLTQANIKYQELEENFTGLTEDIVIATPGKLTHQALRALRHGICVNQSGVVATQHFQFYTDKVKESDRLVDYNMLGYEFKHLIIGMAMNTFVHRFNNDPYFRERKLEWHDTRNFIQAFPAMFPDTEFHTFFDQGSNKTLQNAGFLTITPNRLAPLLNIYTDLIK
jgi:hypothetical protein